MFPDDLQKTPKIVSEIDLQNMIKNTDKIEAKWGPDSGCDPPPGLNIYTCKLTQKPSGALGRQLLTELRGDLQKIAQSDSKTVSTIELKKDTENRKKNGSAAQDLGSRIWAGSGIRDPGGCRDPGWRSGIRDPA